MLHRATSLCYFEIEIMSQVHFKSQPVSFEMELNQQGRLEELYNYSQNSANCIRVNSAAFTDVAV
jgi:hypothetical protein